MEKIREPEEILKDIENNNKEIQKITKDIKEILDLDDVITEIGDVIKLGILKENVFYFPKIELERKVYLKIAKHLEFLGGKWNRSKKGFVFDRDIENVEELMGDNIKKKKELQFFETPKELAKELVELAEINNDINILEPSAGRGAIIKKIRNIYHKQIQYCEIDETNKKYLKKINNVESVGDDFLQLNKMTFDRIIANPPFSKNQDIEHIKHMFSLLRNKGILVSIASRHWLLSNNKKETEFRMWLTDVGAEIMELKGGEFKESGTIIKGVIIKIKK